MKQPSVIIPLRCRCGAVRGTVDAAPDAGLRVVCYCDDCQAYARALGRDDVLDEHGGTDIWQTPPARLALTAGLEQVRCMRLNPEGMLRWHAACCGTPIGNTMASPCVPFVGVVGAFMDHAAHPRDEVLGAPTRMQARFAVGTPPRDAHPRASLAFIARALAFLLRGALARAHRPTPFFDAAGRPVVEPRVLSPAARAALRPA